MSNKVDFVLKDLRSASDNDTSWYVDPSEAVALIEEIERLRAEVSYLRACVPPVHPGDYGHEAWAEEAARAENANAEDAKKERAAVVAWLRGFDTNTQSASSDLRWCIRGLANCIERGEHRREEEK